jgi:hypothetical protein
MDDSRELLAELARSLTSGPAEGSLALRLCGSAISILGATGGSMTFASADPGRTVVAASDLVAEGFEQLQDVLGEGPGLRAHREGRVVVLALGAPSHDGAMFAEEAGRDHPGHTIYALPMRPFSQAFGVIMLYTAPGRWLARTTDEAQFLADAIGAAVLRYPEIDDLNEAWVPRARIHQATGMVVAQLGIRSEDALALLRARAFADSITLDEMAVQVLEREVTFARPDDAEGGRS